MPSLSIIIPVYNAENQIRRCLDSLRTQKTEEIEILVINDGSTDFSHDVIEKYNQEYPRVITYYQKENTGVADTRNFGITHAKGDYILFVDSDDYLEFDFIQYMHNYMQKGIDIIKFKMQRVNEIGEVIEKIEGPIFEEVTGEEAFSRLVFEDTLIDSPCIYIIRKEVFLKNNLAFKVGTEHEDFGLIPLLLVSAKTMISTAYYGYYYVQTADSITRNESYLKIVKKAMDSLSHYDAMLLFLSKKTFTKRTQKEMKIYFTNAILLKIASLQGKERKLYKQEIRKRHMVKNIKVNNIKQLIKKMILLINIEWYLKLR